MRWVSQRKLQHVAFLWMRKDFGAGAAAGVLQQSEKSKTEGFFPKCCKCIIIITAFAVIYVLVAQLDRAQDSDS